MDLSDSIKAQKPVEITEMKGAALPAPVLEGAGVIRFGRSRRSGGSSVCARQSFCRGFELILAHSRGN